MRMIFGSDFSENAERAGKVAAAPAQRLGATLLVLREARA